ncbi:MAG: hypothetical protein QM589_08825 [Thermomicrobiales bacterium]
MRNARCVVLVGALCMTATIDGGTALAETGATPEAIAPAASCSIPPLTLPLFGGTPATALLATPVPVGAGTLTPVDAETEMSVRAGVAEILACLNVGDPKQTYAVFTTGYLARTFGNPATAYLPAFEQSLDEAPDASAPHYTAPAFTIEGQTAGGQVVVSLTVTADDQSWTDTLVLVNVGGHWLIDSVLT